MVSKHIKAEKCIYLLRSSTIFLKAYQIILGLLNKGYQIIYLVIYQRLSRKR